MKLARLEILDTYGTKQLALEPKSVTFLRGKNGSGKSSVLKALLYIFDGGADPGVIRRGAKRSVVRMVTDNGVKIEKTTTPSGARLEITDAAGLVVPNPATFLRELAESIALNPARLLKIDTSTKPGKRQLIQELLETMPVQFAPEDLEAIAPKTMEGDIQPPALVALAKIRETWPPNKVDLEGIDKYQKTIEESRRKVGQERDECQKGADALSKSIPAVEDGEAARKKLAEVDARLRSIYQAEQEAVVANVKSFSQARAEAQAEFDRKISLLKQLEYDKKGEIDLEYIPQVEAAKSEQAVLREKVSAADRAAGAREQIGKLRDRYRQHDAAYSVFSAALDLLKAAKAQKLEHLPIPGLSFDDGEVSVDGVRWQDVNTARLVEVAVQHAALRPGELNLMVEDDAEHLDEDTQRMLSEALVGAGYQVIYAEVLKGQPLTVVTFPGVGERPDGTLSVAAD